MRRFKVTFKEHPAYSAVLAIVGMLAILVLFHTVGAGALAFSPFLVVPFMGAALAKDRDTLTITRPQLKGYNVLNNTTIFKGSLVALNAAGWLIPATATAGLKVVGVADEQVVSPVTDAAGAKKCRVRAGELYDFSATSITQAMLGTVMYVVDDNTFDDVPGVPAVKAGVLVEFISVTRGLIYIVPGGGSTTA